MSLAKLSLKPRSRYSDSVTVSRLCKKIERILLSILILLRGPITKAIELFLFLELVFV